MCDRQNFAHCHYFFLLSEFQIIQILRKVKHTDEPVSKSQEWILAGRGYSADLSRQALVSNKTRDCLAFFNGCFVAQTAWQRLSCQELMYIKVQMQLMVFFF